MEAIDSMNFIEIEIKGKKYLVKQRTEGEAVDILNVMKIKGPKNFITYEKGLEFIGISKWCSDKIEAQILSIPVLPSFLSFKLTKSRGLANNLSRREDDAIRTNLQAWCCTFGLRKSGKGQEKMSRVVTITSGSIWMNWRCKQCGIHLWSNCWRQSNLSLLWSCWFLYCSCFCWDWPDFVHLDWGGFAGKIEDKGSLSKVGVVIININLSFDKEPD